MSNKGNFGYPKNRTFIRSVSSASYASTASYWSGNSIKTGSIYSIVSTDPNKIFQIIYSGSILFNISSSGAIFHGINTLAIGSHSHAEGQDTITYGTGSHAEGHDSIATGNFSHAEGVSTLASNFGAHAEGNATLASGLQAHAEGNATTASGDNSHAEGIGTIALGNNSHAEGEGTVSSGSAQLVIGKYNKNNNTTALFIIGNGSIVGPGPLINRSDLALFYSQSIIFSSSLSVTNGITGSLLGTASYWSGSITNALSASYASTSSYAERALSASYFSGSISNAITSSYALTASYLEGFVTSASYASTASYFSGSITNAISASFASTSSWVRISQTASYWSGSITNVLSSSFASTASYWSGSITNVLSASYASTSSYLIGNLKTKSGTIISASFGGTPLTTSVITFTTPFENNNYSISITSEVLRTFTIQNKNSGSFVVNSNSSVLFTGNTFWIAISNGES